MNSEFAIPAVGALIFNLKKRVFLVKSSGKFGDQWIIPGGKVAFGESLTNALSRELREETKMQIDGSKLLGAREHLSEAKHFIFLECVAWIRDPGVIELNEEATEYGWFNRNEIRELNIAAPTQALIEERWDTALEQLPPEFI